MATLKKGGDYFYLQGNAKTERRRKWRERMTKDQEGKEEEMTSHYKISDYYCIQSIWGIKSSWSQMHSVICPLSMRYLCRVLQITD